MQDARNKVGDQFTDAWDAIEARKDTSAKRVSLFSWIRNRGFTDAMIQETNIVMQKETLRTGKDLVEYHELCASLNLNPLKPATTRFIDDGVAKVRVTYSACLTLNTL